MKENMSKPLKVVLLTLLVAGILLFIGGNLMVDFALSPTNRGKDISASFDYIRSTYPQLNPYLDSLQRTGTLRDTTIAAPDGTKLHGYYIHAACPTRRTAVIVHGYTDNAIRMLMIAYLYNHNLGFNVLLPDLRYSGQSEGDYLQMGWNDRIDIIQWIDVANSLYGNTTEMVLHGISMGAATVMMASGEKLPTYVKCLVEDCGYTSVWDEFQGEIKKQFGLPAFPLLHISSVVCSMRYGWNFQEASALRQVEKCRLPMFFIHGKNDTFVPTEMVYRLYEAKPQPKELWIVPSEGHALSYSDFPLEYTLKVKEFVEKYIN